MKKFIYSIFILLLLVSCNDFLDVRSKSTFSDDVIYSDPSLTEGAIMGIYNVIGENNSYRNRLWMQMGLNTDIEFRPGASGSNPSTSVKAEDLISLYKTNSDMGDGYNNEDAANPWSRIYQAIERANLCIKGIKEYGDPQKGTVMGHLLGEALALRAFFYYDLIKWWGDVPFRTEPVNENNLYIPKTKRAIIYDQIISDLGLATELMFPAGNEKTKTVKRLSLDAVRGLRARICLSAAGYAMHPDENGNAVIKYTFDDENKRKELYTIALNECKAIIDDARYKLDNSFQNIFYENCQDVETHGREVIFELPYNIGVRGRNINYFGLKNAAGSKYTSYGCGGGVRIMPSFYYDFDDKDLRRNVTAQPYEVIVEQNITKQSVTSIVNIQLAKFRAEWCKVPITSTEDGVSPIILRYSDVLLMYAEAALYLNENITEGKEYFNMVRRRAFGLPINSVSAIDKELTLDNIKQERAFEFCGENIRKYDLIRWGELKKKIDEAKENIRNLRDSTGNYINIPREIYYKTDTFASDEFHITFYGLKRNETEDKTVTEPSKGWIKKSWINSVSNGEQLLNDTWINYLYHGDPDKRQLLPIMSIIINKSQGKLKNDYGYNN
jgi:hypothetical protein